jgi:hypothetical protein
MHVIDSTELSPSWEKQFPIILWNPKVHYHVHKSPPLASNLSQINPDHSTPSCLSKIHLNIIILAMVLVFLVSYILWYPKVHYYVHKSPPLLPNLNHFNPVHTTQSYSVRFILILSSTYVLSLPSGLFPSGFSTYCSYILTFSSACIRYSNCSERKVDD